MKPVLKDVLAEKDSLNEQLHCADQIIRGMRAKSVFIARHGAVTVLLAAPKAAHGGVAMIEFRTNMPGKSGAPDSALGVRAAIGPRHVDVRREYGYLERLHAAYRRMSGQGYEEAASVYGLLGQAMKYRNDLLRADQETFATDEEGPGMEVRG